MRSALGIDIGTGSMKAALAVRGKVEIFHGSYDPAPAGVPRFSQSPDVLAGSFKKLCRTCAEAGGADRIEAIALSGHGPSLVCLDRAGAPLGPLVTWQDNSASREAVELRASMPAFDKDGSSWEAKCLAAWNRWGTRIARFLTPKDFLNFLLTGCAATDASTASTVRFADSEGRDWSNTPGLLSAEPFPRIVEPWAEVGLTGTAFSRECGFPDGVPVLGGGIDAYCEAAGAGADDEGDLVDGSGTSTCISVCASGSVGDYHVIPGKRLRIQTMSCTGSSLKWLDSILGGSSGGGPLPRWTPVLYHPFLDGERSPYWDERLRASFIGLDGSRGAADLRAAVLQGVAFGIRQNVEILESELNIAGKRVRACGGGAENETWLRMKANVLGRSFIRPAFKDTAPLGDLRLCGVFLGLKQPLAEWGVPSEGRIVEPDATDAERALLDELYDEYRLTAKLLAASCHRLADLADRSRAAELMQGGMNNEKNA